MREKSVFLSCLAASLILTLLVVPGASGHSVQTDWEIGKLKVIAWYGGGDPMEDATVEIYTPETSGNELYENGKMNENGVFFFPPKVGVENYQVVVQSSGGHRDNLTINLGSKSSEKIGEGMPLYTRIGAGFGYLIGLAGIALGYLGWKKKREYGEE